MAPHRRAGHAVQALANRLVGRMYNQFAVIASENCRLVKADQRLKHRQIPIGQAERDSSGSELPQDLPLVGAGWGQVFLGRCLMFQDGSIYRSPERRYGRVVHFVIHEDKNIPVRESLWTCGK